MANLKRKDAEKVVQWSIVDDDIVTVQVYPYTLVEIYVTIRGNCYRGIGMTKSGPRDVWNPLIGLNIAYGRAVKQVIKNSRLLNEQR